MKKLTIFLLVSAMVLVFTACANKGESVSGSEISSTVNSESDNGKADNIAGSGTSGISEKEWNAATERKNFENVTFSYEATFISGYQDAGPHMGVLKITEDAVVMDGELLTAQETINAAKNAYIDITLAVINNFDDFEYDDAKNCYNAKKSITYNTEVLEYKATITAENVSVELDSENRISTISCKMTQEIVGGSPITYVLDAKFTFTDYGTTTVQ